MNKEAYDRGQGYDRAVGPPVYNICESNKGQGGMAGIGGLQVVRD
jgi:hypothetical protein